MTATPHSFFPGLRELDFEHRMQYLTKHLLEWLTYTYGGFGKIVERRDNVWAAGRDQNDSVAAIYSHLDDKVWGTFPWKFKSSDVQKGPF